jgi:hypothetical protein
MVSVVTDEEEKLYQFGKYCVVTEAKLLCLVSSFLAFKK